MRAPAQQHGRRSFPRRPVAPRRVRASLDPGIRRGAAPGPERWRCCARPRPSRCRGSSVPGRRLSPQYCQVTSKCESFSIMIEEEKSADACDFLRMNDTVDDKAVLLPPDSSPQAPMAPGLASGNCACHQTPKRRRLPRGLKAAWRGLLASSSPAERIGPGHHGDGCRPGRRPDRQHLPAHCWTRRDCWLAERPRGADPTGCC